MCTKFSTCEYSVISVYIFQKGTDYDVGTAFHVKDGVLSLPQHFGIPILNTCHHVPQSSFPTFPLLLRSRPTSGRPSRESEVELRVLVMGDGGVGWGGHDDRRDCRD